MQGLSRDIRRLTEASFEFSEVPAFDDFQSGYEEYLLGKFGDNSLILEYPNVSHSNVAKRAIEKKKPFKKSGDGYRDTLVWESILQVLSRNDRPDVVFVSNNRSDFWDGEQLASDLLSDLDERGIAHEKVTPFLTVKALIDERILPQLNQLEELAANIAGRQVPGIDFAEWLQDAIFDAIDANEAGRVIAQVQPGECLIELSEVYEVNSINVEHEFLLTETDRYIVLTADVGIGIDVCADWWQYEESEAIETLFDQEGFGQPTPYSCVYVGKPVHTTFSLLIHSYDPFDASVEVLGMASTQADD